MRNPIQRLVTRWFVDANKLVHNADITPLENMTNTQKTEIEAAAFRRLLKHLNDNKDVQNIDLMILANFCRNCLAKWYRAAAEDQNIEIDYEQAREKIYGMPYSEWKDKFQADATPEQMAAFEAKQKK